MGGDLDGDGRGGRDAPEQVDTVVEEQKASRLTTWGRKLARVGRRSADELDAAALRLVADAGAAQRLRSYQQDPHVAALGIERTRDRLDGYGWILLFAGLAFTTVNVQAFVADGAEVGSLFWWTAWLVEPLVMGMMLVLLRGEQIANRHGEKSHGWVQFTRWFSLGVTYVMNTGAYWSAGDIKGVFVHSIPVLLVALSAEALVRQRLTLTKVVDQVGSEKAPETAQETPDEETEDEETEDELSDHRLPVDRARDAFMALAAERELAGDSIETIGPTEVDRAADVTIGTSKRPGRMEKFREEYRSRTEVNDGDGGSEVQAGTAGA